MRQKGVAKPVARPGSKHSTTSTTSTTTTTSLPNGHKARRMTAPSTGAASDSSSKSRKSKLQSTTTTPTRTKKSPPHSNGTASQTTSKSNFDNLSPRERALLKLWLDASDRPFQIHTAPLSRKRKRDEEEKGDVWLPQTNLWEDRLSVQYCVRPMDKWKDLRIFKRFTVGTDSIAPGQCILVKHDDADDIKIDWAKQWKAMVLEVRAIDSEHVYLRVAWLNRPEDLVGGRKPHHGHNELIPTNQLDVIDAMAVNGSFEVVHWPDNTDEEENEEEAVIVAEDQFFWRQTYDYAMTKTYSKLGKICIDETPQNPDEMILQCSSAACRKWMHVKCCAEQAVQRAVAESSSSISSRTPCSPSARSPNHNHTPCAPTPTPSVPATAAATATKGRFSASVYVRDNNTPSPPPHANDPPIDPFLPQSDTNMNMNVDSANAVNPLPEIPARGALKSEIVIQWVEESKEGEGINGVKAKGKKKSGRASAGSVNGGQSEGVRGANIAGEYRTDLKCLFCGMVVD